MILSNEQLDEGICYLKELVKYFVDTQVQSHGKTRDEKDITTQENTKELVIEPPLKTFRHLSKLVSKQISQNKEIASTTSEEQEVDLFIQQIKSNPPDVMDALDFWVKSESLFPVLSKLACDVLVVPASSAPVERTFSIAGNACIGKRNRLSGNNLEREVLINNNKDYLHI